MKIIRAQSSRVVWLAIVLSRVACPGQVPSPRSVPGTDRTDRTRDEYPASVAASSETEQARDELQRGTALTRQGRFKEAIPHLLAAREGVTNPYAAEFNLSLCYVGTGEYDKAIPILERLRREGHESVDVENLLAQAFVGKGQRADALAALQRATAISPQNEKLFAFVADACADHQDFELGLTVVDIGLRTLPQSARLHYQRGMLLSQLDQFDQAKPDFQFASRIDLGSEIGYLSAAYENLLEGNLPDTIRFARQSISHGFQTPMLLTILGQALLRSGITPGQPEFNEAQSALEKSVSEQPNDASSQIALGQLYLTAGRIDQSIAHLQTARQMRPNQTAIYATLARAYQRLGDAQQAQEALAKLESLNQAQAERIRSAPGERKMSYGGTQAKQME
jgi:tetratricopeptide (TPR) repeat protein